MLAPRFLLQSPAPRGLTKDQIEAIETVKRRILDGHYQLISPPCVICNSDSFECLAERDRYGLPMSVVVCRACGLVQTRPRMDATAYAHFYDMYYAAIYHPFKNKVEDYFREQYKRGNRIANWIEKCLDRTVSGLAVLEVGCGAGGVLAAFRDRGARVRGCDLIHSYVDHATMKHDLDVVYGTLQSMTPQPYPDLVIYSHVVEHLSNPLDELAVLQNLCISRQAHVYVEVPGLFSIRENYRWDILQYLQNAHIWHFTLDTLTALMAKGGFRRTHGTDWVFSLFLPCGEREPFQVDEAARSLAWLQDTEKGRRRALLYPATLRREAIRLVLRCLDFFGIREWVFHLRERV